MIRARLTQQEISMNAYKTAALKAALAVMFTAGLAGAAAAQGMAAPKDSMAGPSATSSGMAAPKDSMAMGKPMAKKKTAKKGAMASDAMKGGAMTGGAAAGGGMSGPAH
jgi:hypothetical protein